MIRSLRRPLVALTAAALGLSGLSGCNAVRNSATAVSVNGVAWSRDDFNTLMDALVKAGQFPAPNGQVDTKSASQVISVMVQFKVGQQMLESLGKKISAADKQKLVDAINQQAGTLDDKTKALLVDIAATGGAIDALPVPTDEQSSAAYEKAPASSGAMCVAEITLTSEAKAREVADQLAEGAKFADVARANTTNTDRKASGGLVVDGAGNECQTLSSVDDRVSAEVLQVLYTLAPGKPTPVIHDADGWHIAVNRPWADIRTAHAKAVSSTQDVPAGRQLLAGHIAVADIEVNSIYGTWNQVTARVE